ncbi:MAG: hypothetical protein VKI93_04800 [Synechococcus sp.]|nr:hypothetical protein [Synechococcus sp.]
MDPQRFAPSDYNCCSPPDLRSERAGPGALHHHRILTAHHQMVMAVRRLHG